MRAALRIPRPAHVSGREILVYDDVFTDGFTLREVARALRRAGAATVCGVTLTRQPGGGERRSQE
jgi:predicted amidophosphoribosyltransferase